MATEFSVREKQAWFELMFKSARQPISKDKLLGTFVLRFNATWRNAQQLLKAYTATGRIKIEGDVITVVK